jgi:hypothetical protein
MASSDEYCHLVSLFTSRNPERGREVEKRRRVEEKIESLGLRRSSVLIGSIRHRSDYAVGLELKEIRVSLQKEEKLEGGGGVTAQTTQQNLPINRTGSAEHNGVVIGIQNIQVSYPCSDDSRPG